jgi:hypothetical protein
MINGFKRKLQLIHFLTIALVNSSLVLLNSMTRMLECDFFLLKMMIIARKQKKKFKKFFWKEFG